MRQVIAVSSGKGGVRQEHRGRQPGLRPCGSQGLRVGLLDADIYGPNAPTMLGVADRTPEVEARAISAADDSRSKAAASPWSRWAC